jgi:hypothetical protein
MLTCFKGQHGILEVVRVGCGNVDNIDVRIVNKLCVGSIGFSCARCLDVFQELRGAGSGGGRRCGSNDMLNIVNIASSRISKDIFREG